MLVSRVFFFNDTATTEIYTLSLHDALPIWGGHQLLPRLFGFAVGLLRLVLLLLADERGAELADEGPGVGHDGTEDAAVLRRGEGDGGGGLFGGRGSDELVGEEEGIGRGQV